MTSKPEPADERLLAAHDLARAALHEVTAPATVGEAAGYTVEDDGVVSLRFHNTLDGYPGWLWTVSLAVVDGAEPTVLEVELLPGEGALLAPEWVPWAVRLADYQAAQAAQADEADDDESEELDDLDDLDAADFDEDGSSILHAGDVDGVDIDALDEDADDSDAEEDSDPEDDGADGADDESEDAADAD